MSSQERFDNALSHIRDELENIEELFEEKAREQAIEDKLYALQGVASAAKAYREARKTIDWYISTKLVPIDQLAIPMEHLRKAELALFSAISDLERKEKT